MKYKENSIKNLRHIYSVLCSSSVLDQESNNISLHNLVEQLNIKFTKEDVEKKKKEGTRGFVVPVQLQLVTRLQKHDKEKDVTFELKLDFIDPDGDILNSTQPQSIAFKKSVRNLRMRNGIPSILVDKEGMYTISVSIREVGDSSFTEVDRVPLEITTSTK